MQTKFLFSEENAKKAADEIVDRFCSTSDETNTELDYEIKQGRMVQTGDPNLYFKFNIEKEKVLSEYIEFFKDTISETIYKEESEWISMIKQFILSRIDEIRNAIRTRLLKNAMEELIPLKSIEIKNLDFTPFAKDNILLVIEKEVKNEDVSFASIRDDLLATQEETGKMLNEIITQRKLEGDNRYFNIKSAYAKYYVSEIELSLLVDFSLTPKEDFIKLMSKK